MKPPPLACLAIAPLIHALSLLKYPSFRTMSEFLEEVFQETRQTRESAIKR
jgi:hypothetical protein